MEGAAVVRSIVQMVDNSDRQVIERVLTDTVCEMLPGTASCLLRVDPEDAPPLAVVSAAGRGADDLIASVDWQQVLAAARQRRLSAACPCATLAVDGLPPDTVAIDVPLSDDQTWTFLIIGGRALVDGEPTVAMGLATIFRNYVGALAAGQVDGLTRLYNRKTFDERLGMVIAEVVEHHRNQVDERRHVEHPATWLAVADIDHFKRVNDAFGHIFGDEVLLLFAQTMRRTFRRHDLLFRYGGEEFAVVLPNTGETGAWAVLERFRQAIAEARIPQVGLISCSIGFTRVGPDEVPTALFGRADQALYYAKQSGRNRVCNFENLVHRGLLKVHSGEHLAQVELF
ncbi:MAG: GGDEF domain-containing protein [Actinomycetota bacterium]